MDKIKQSIQSGIIKDSLVFIISENFICRNSFSLFLLVRQHSITEIILGQRERERERERERRERERERERREREREREREIFVNN